MSYIRKLPFISGLFFTSPPYHTGKVWENKLGLQLVRVIGRKFLLSTKSIKNGVQENDFTRKLKEYGYFKIENFLSKSDFELVLQEIEKLRSKVELIPYKPSENPSMFVRREDFSANKEMYPEINRLFALNPILNSAASSILKLDPTKDIPKLSFLGLTKTTDEVDDDIENILHADVHYDTIKAFFYIHDVGISNGTYIYAKGSNKLTKDRILYEYNLSVRVAKLKRGDTDISQEYLEKRGNIIRNIMSKKQYQRLKINEVPMVGKANTLVMSNNLGFHRRGEFETGTKREIILIDFRNLGVSKLRKKLSKSSS